MLFYSLRTLYLHDFKVGQNFFSAHERFLRACGGHDHDWQYCRYYFIHYCQVLTNPITKNEMEKKISLNDGCYVLKKSII